jgi:hypothetical protein
MIRELVIAGLGRILGLRQCLTSKDILIPEHFNVSISTYESAWNRKYHTLQVSLPSERKKAVNTGINNPNIW